MKKIFASLLLLITLLPTAFAVAPNDLTDITGHPYEDAIRYLVEKNIVQGYPNHTYQAQKSVNRAEFTKIVVGATLGTEPSKPSENCFPDVDKNQWFATWVCYAKSKGIIGGYPTGDFKPNETINLAEASKILVNTLSVKMSTKTDGDWYMVFIRSLQDLKYIPDSFSSISQLVNRGQMAEMVYRIMEKISTRPAKVFNFDAPLACLDDQVPANVDMKAVREAWLGWHNQARADRGIGSLTLNTGLNYSSSLWAKSNKKDGAIMHTRANNQSITDWFTAVGIKFKPLTGIMFGENLGYRTYRCSASDCTQEAISTAHAIFDAFMAEQGTSYTGHYDNIVTPDFKEVGLGIAIDTTKEAMFLTTEYSFGVESYPSNLCSL